MELDASRSGAAEAAVHLLLVDDDQPFQDRLKTMLDRNGFVVTGASSIAEARSVAHLLQPSYAVIDLKLEDGSGLDLVGELRTLNPMMKIIVLTGYGNLATAVAAVKAGAVDYLAKPADPLDIIRALNALPGEHAEAPSAPMSGEQVRLELIQQTFVLAGQNLSETARRLRMHRRTLQRILGKQVPA